MLGGVKVRHTDRTSVRISDTIEQGNRYFVAGSHSARLSCKLHFIQCFISALDSFRVLASMPSAHKVGM